MSSISYENLNMSVVGNSPLDSSSSNDFMALLDAELDQEGAKEEVVDFETERIKRQRAEDRFDNVKEFQGSTSLEPMPQNSDASVKLAICEHPEEFVGGMCVLCGQEINDGSAVALEYIQKGLKMGAEVLARRRAKELKSLFCNKKLYLVLDLDHTVLNSTRFIDISPDEKYLKSQTDSLQDIPNGSLFKLDRIQYFTKLRPFVRTFLKEASSMYEMYVYTMGERHYALEMAQLLDPGNVYFDSKVISRDDCIQKHRKGLDVMMLGTDSAVIILDDKESVWEKDKDNLILMDRYHYFSSSCRTYGLKKKSLSESKSDESESNGLLATILQVLKRIHQMFFDSELGDDLMGRDVRQVLKTLRREVLKGCNLVFSGVWKIRTREMAKQLGATCSKELDPSVTHVVSTDTGTEESLWAVKHQKFLVHPRWIEAANFLWKRQPEENFAVSESKNQ